MPTIALIVLLTSMAPFVILGIFAALSLKVETSIREEIGR